MNPNSLGETESGYGRNPDGTEKDKNDYYAENPNTAGDEYYNNIERAEKEASQDEILREVVASLKEDVARLDALLNSVRQGSDATKLGSTAVSSIAAEKLDNMEESKATEQGELLDKTPKPETRYLNSQGQVFSTSSEALDSDPNRRND